MTGYLIVGGGCLLVGHFWGGTIWPAIKAKIWPGSVPIPPPKP